MSDFVPLEAKQMYAIGPRTEEAVRAMFSGGQHNLFVLDASTDHPVPKEALEKLARALLQSPKWSDDESERLLRAIAGRLADNVAVDVSLVSRWVLAHNNDSNSVLLCLDATPPDEIEIRRILSKAGSQKHVFLASWRLTQKDVVVKRLISGESEVYRDLEAFPLNLSHPNIIETYRLTNSVGEQYLVEDLLPTILSDDWRAQGVQEAANLLHDIAAAARYIHDNDRAHGDIKPDNIGARDGYFILLDFGICRRIAEFTPEATATGSLRTRAPELLPHGTYLDPRKADVWAIGATLFNALSGRFPLINSGEHVPRIMDVEGREVFEKELARRASESWDQWVDLSLIPPPLQSILGEMLERDPSKRASTADIMDRIRSELPAYLHGGSARMHRESRFSPIEELQQLLGYVEALHVNVSVPARVVESLTERLNMIATTPGLDAESQLDARAAALRLAERRA